MGSKKQNEPQGTETGDNSASGAMLTEAISIRSVALVSLTTMASLVFINWAQAILLPLVVAVMISYALAPLVSTLDRLKIPRPLSAALVLICLLSAIAAASVPLQHEAMAILDKVPIAISEFQRNESRSPPKEEGIMEKAQAAAQKIEESTAQEDKSPSQEQRHATPVRIVEKPMDIQKYVLKGSPAALVLVSQMFSVLLLVYFILSAGSLYKRKIVKISGPSFGRMRKAARILDDFHRQVRRFLFVMLLGALFVGLLTWVAFLALGVEQAMLWGVIAGVASAIPYLGRFPGARGHQRCSVYSVW